jgi:PAS domain S-box-containing protein
MQSIPYKYKLSILVAIVFPWLSRLMVQGSGGEYQLFGYLIPLIVGGLTGYLAGYLLDKWQKSLQLSRAANISLQRKIQEGRIREGWSSLLFEKNQAIFLLINSTTGLIEDANRSACVFYGYSPEQFKRIHISEITPLTIEENDDETAQATARDRRRLFSRHKLASGEEKDVQLFAGSIVIDGTTFLFLVVNDLSEQEGLRGVIPICAHCKQIRDGEGNWNQLEEYIQRRSHAEFSHGLCPGCARQHYPRLYQLDKN